MDLEEDHLDLLDPDKGYKLGLDSLQDKSEYRLVKTIIPHYLMNCCWDRCYFRDPDLPRQKRLQTLWTPSSNKKILD
jgi:hypothetical protein